MASRNTLSGSPTSRGEPNLRASIERGLPNASAGTVDILVETARIQAFRRHVTIFRQDEPIPMALLLRGYGLFRRTTVDGQQLAVGIGGPTELFGYSSIALVNTTVDMVALTDADVALWSGPELRALAGTDLGLALDAIDRLAGFANVITEKIDGFLHQDSRRRVIRILARHQDLFFGEPPVLARSDLPSLVGTSREMTGRVLRELEREGTLARVGRRGLRLLHPDGLELDAMVRSTRAP
ncbi:MAG TPA: Crp/Fnr family transcriptional regulator [Verrucomicrobiae bacterium]|nr:Crp/Fnr family transcriptional regulator [Verrucomicrobiae bacterium]